MTVVETINELIQESLGFLTSEHDFKLGEQESDGEYVSQSFHSGVFDIRIENYRHEVYAYVSPHASRDSEINLFVLLQFLCRDTDDNPTSKYFSDVQDTKDSYRKQIQWIAQVIKSYWSEIQNFFCSSGLQDNIKKVRQYAMAAHPELFAKVKG